MNDISVATENDVVVHAGTAELPGTLVVPRGATGIVLFAHGSGSSRFSRRNRFVADVLNKAGLATLLFDLLTQEESTVDELTAIYRFDIPLLITRLEGAVTWVQGEPALSAMKIGLFGASTGAAAALGVAARRPDAVAAVVSRGGRPDLAGSALPLVRAPTLLVVGGRDQQVLSLNRDAATRLRDARDLRIEVVPGATHLFEESGTLEQAARLACTWFTERLTPHASDAKR